MNSNAYAFIVLIALVTGASLSGRVSKWFQTRAKKKALKQVAEAKTEAAEAQVRAKVANVTADVAQDVAHVASDLSQTTVQDDAEYRRTLNRIEAAKNSNNILALSDVAVEMAKKALLLGAKEKE